MKMTIFLFILLFFGCNQANTSKNVQKLRIVQEDTIKSETKDTVTSNAPSNIVRSIIQDRKGNIWMASWEGIFRYDGKSFTNLTSKFTAVRFFSVLEDRKGNLWFGTIGEGVYRYDGKTFQNLTTKDGLLNNEVVSIYEDKVGNIWFGTWGGASRYDGKSFQNYSINEDSMDKDWIAKNFSKRPAFEVNAIIEDKKGKFWFATRGNTFVYDGKTFTPVTQNGKPFTNVRWIIEDKKANIWLGGNDGLWRYDGTIYTNISQNFTGYIYEDKNGNIWTSSTSAMYGKQWVFSRYDEKFLCDKKPTVSEIKEKQMVFGILEDYNGNFWFGSGDGVYRYDGKTVIGFHNQ